MRHVVKIFKALSDPNRLRIIKMLQIRPLCVCEITDILQLAPSTVSKHLSLLRDVELILDDKDGKWVNYRINQFAADEYAGQLLPLLKKWLPNDQIIQQDAAKVNGVDRNVICST